MRLFNLTCMAILVFVATVSAMPTEPVMEETNTFSISQHITNWFGSAKAESKSICEELDWRTSSLKLLKEIPAGGLFENLKGTTKWEISGMVVVNKMIHMIFDSIPHIGQVEERFQYMAPNNILIDEKNGPVDAGDSQYESIEYSADTDTYLITKEAIAHPEKEGVWRAHILEAKISGSGASQTYTTLHECPLDYEFSSENKGIEGGAYIYKDSTRYFLGLCEGNYCEGGVKGKTPGNGRIIVSTFKKSADGEADACGWEQVKVMHLPKEADFPDYADVSILGNNIAVVSQEAAAIWIGDINIEKWTISGPGVVYHFPRDNNCEQIYCNVEGIAFLDEHRIAAASDRSKATQHYNCVPHDQSVMVFQLPKPVKSHELGEL